jgi:hypothetical protein
MEFTIEKDVPIPEGMQRLHRYPLTKMEIGESFVASEELRNSISASRAHMWKRYGKKFKIAKIRNDPKYPHHVRVWRIT